MIITAIATLTVLAGMDAKPLSCPIMGGPANTKAGFSDYNGVRVYYCCPGCESGFGKDPAKASAEATKKGLVYGVSLFDPVTGNRLTEKKAIKETSDFGGVRFMFASAENKAKFDADPKKYGTLPVKEALYCPVGKEAVETYAKSSGYVDYEGVRYYMCCGGCEGPMKKDPAKVVGNAKTYVKAPGIATEKKAG